MHNLSLCTLGMGNKRLSLQHLKSDVTEVDIWEVFFKGVVLRMQRAERWSAVGQQEGP